MKRLILLAVAVWCLTGPAPAHAQIFNFFRKAPPPPPPPAQRVPQLIGIVKTDAEESKRVAAVQELRDHDTKAFPEIVPILVDVAKSDAKAGVRAEAVNSLVRIRPISTLAGQAIEKVAAGDESWKNRMSAQAALVRYRLAGYSSPPAPPSPSPPVPARTTSQQKNSSPQLPQSQEPPLNDAPPAKDDGSIYYFDANGKRIPAPANIDRPIIRAPSTPNGNPAPFVPPNFTPPPLLQPTPPSVVTTVPVAPPTLLPPKTPNVSEPIFRAVPQPTNTVPVVPPMNMTPPRPPVLIAPTPTAEPQLQGPSLDLPIVPNGPALNPVPQLAPIPINP